MLPCTFIAGCGAFKLPSCFCLFKAGGVSKTSSMFPSASRGVGSHRRFKPTHVLAPSHPESSVLLAGRLHRTTSLYPLSAGNAEAMTSKNLGPVLALDLFTPLYFFS